MTGVVKIYARCARMGLQLQKDKFPSKGECIMNNTGKDQGWQQIRAKVEELLRQSLAGNPFYRIEYKPSDVAHFLEMPRDYRNEHQEIKP
jgi:hypothetical protein